MFKSMYAQQRKEARERIAFKGPITPTFIASAKDTFKVKIDKDEINKDELSASFQARTGLKTAPCGKDENGYEKNSLTWHASSNLWVAINTFIDSGATEPTPHCISLRDYWHLPQVDSIMQDPDLIKDVNFVDAQGTPITLEQAFELNEKFGASHSNAVTRVLHMRAKRARAHEHLNAKLKLFGLPARDAPCTDMNAEINETLKTPKRTFGIMAKSSSPSGGSSSGAGSSSGNGTPSGGRPDALEEAQIGSAVAASSSGPTWEQVLDETKIKKEEDGCETSKAAGKRPRRSFRR